MKRIYKYLILLLLILFLSGCNNKIIKNIELEDSSCKITKDKDTHKDYNGDGDYFAKIKCSNIDYNKLSKHWHSLPLSEELTAITNVDICDDKDCKNVYKRYSIPKIKNGYYYFIDRHPQSKDKYDDKDINTRSSYNFTLAILDKDNNTVYYYELDT